jgi:hypothetical protein
MTIVVLNLVFEKNDNFKKYLLKMVSPKGFFNI